MKFYRKTVILISVMCLLFTACLFLYNGKTESSSEAVITEKLLDVNSEDIVQIELNNAGGKYIFEKKDREWKSIYPENLKFDLSRINGILFAASHLEVMDTIDKQPTDLNQFGLGGNPASVEIKLSNGSKYTLEIGNQTPFKDGYYLKRKDTAVVYKADTGLCSEFLRYGTQLRDGRLFDMPIEDFTAIKFEKEDKTTLNMQKDRGIWKIYSPVEGNSDMKGVEPVLSMLSYLCINSYTEDDAADMTKYGLEKPVYKINVRSDKIEKTLLVGKSKDSDTIYARFSDTKDVWELNRKDLYLIDNPIKEVAVFACMEPIENIERLEINMDNRITNINMAAQQNEKQSGKAVTKSESKFIKLYNEVSKIAMSGIDNDYKPTGNPDITITFVLKSEPKTVKIEFLPRDDLYYYVRNNGENTGILVQRSLFDEPEGIKELSK